MTEQRQLFVIHIFPGRHQVFLIVNKYNPATQIPRTKNRGRIWLSCLARELPELLCWPRWNRMLDSWKLGPIQLQRCKRQDRTVVRIKGWVGCYSVQCTLMVLLQKKQEEVTFCLWQKIFMSEKTSSQETFHSICTVSAFVTSTVKKSHVRGDRRFFQAQALLRLPFQMETLVFFHFPDNAILI